METIGLIAAMTQESDALLRCIPSSEAIRVGKFHGRSFELHGDQCVLVTSGMGTRRAGVAARALIEASSPNRLISFGIAGAVETELAIGDVIVAETVCRFEQGVTTPPHSLGKWPETAFKEATRSLAGRGARLLVGMAVTTGGQQLTEIHLSDMLHPVLEMETAGIAQVAMEKGIALYSIRAISDGPRAPLPIDPAEMMDEDANLRLGRMFKALVQHPGMIFQVGGMMRNTRIAADNAALVVIEMLRNRSAVEG